MLALLGPPPFVLLLLLLLLPACAITGLEERGTRLLYCLLPLLLLLLLPNPLPLLCR